MRFPLRRRLLLVLLAAAVFAALLATADCKKGGRKKSKTSGGMVKSPGEMSAANKLFDRAMSLKQAGQLPEAIKVMEELCGTFPNEWDPQNHLGLMCARRPSPPIPQLSSFEFTPVPSLVRYAAAGRHAEAQRSWNASFANHPRPSEALLILHNLATVTVQLGDVDAAVSMFQRIISIDAYQDAAHKALGVIFGKTGNLNGSAAAYKSCVVANPSNHECWCGLGNTLVRHNLGYEAISAFTAAIRIQPNVAGYHNNLAST
jgi:Flp pilus assembly protein TadD